MMAKPLESDLTRKSVSAFRLGGLDDILNGPRSEGSEFVLRHGKRRPTPGVQRGRERHSKNAFELRFAASAATHCSAARLHGRLVTVALAPLGATSSSTLGA